MTSHLGPPHGSPRSSQNERTVVYSAVFWLKLVIFSLVLHCLLQVVYNINYIVDGSNNFIQEHDPDSPFPKANGNSQTQILSNDVPNAQQEKSIPPISKVVIDPLYSQAQKRIDEKEDERKCFEFGVPVLPKKDRHQKRIFFGSLVANENAEILEAQAMEVYNLYHVIALVESNTTINGQPRRMNYGPGSRNARMLQESEMFGNQTKVVFDYWLEDMPELKDLNREHEFRSTITKIWANQGMRGNDIGVLADMDEIVSREFLNALKVCDFPQLRHDPEIRPTCQVPKMSLSAMQFEGSPLCIKKQLWYHPDVILGNCVENVGDPTGRTNPLRTVKPPGRSYKTLGHRDLGWGFNGHENYPKDVLENNRFPLWSGGDFRNVANTGKMIEFAEVVRMGGKKGQPKPVYAAAYHLHNWFKDTETLRYKYLTYGHPDKKTYQKSLSALHNDLDMMVRCVRDLGNNVPHNWTDPNITVKDVKEFYLGYQLNNDSDNSTDIFSLGGNRPIYFQNKDYVRERHALVQEITKADEEKYGTAYPEDSIRREQERKNAL